MHTIKNIWNKLNGWKTILGGFMALGYGLMVYGGVVENNFDIWAGIAAWTGLGFAHKVVKLFK